VKLNPNGSSLVYGTFIGGSDDDWGSGIAVDGGGNAYVTGSTRSSDFPTSEDAFDPSYNGSWDAFAVKLKVVFRVYLPSSLRTGELRTEIGRID
jgi:hypothetical protein